MATMTATESHVASKPHRCDWCWQYINKGETYKRYRVFNCGDAATVRAHEECYEAIQDAAIEEGGWVEWTPGQDRPNPASSQSPQP